MVRKEPEDGSSSQNVNLFIADLRKRGSRKETVTVALSEGSSFFIPADWAERFAKGTGINEDELEEIRRIDCYIRCKEWAAGFLAVREESSGRLLQKMAVRGFDNDTGLRVINEMQALGFQDDIRYAELWLEGRMKKHPESRILLEAGLVQRGVDRDIARNCVQTMVDDAAEEEMLHRCIEKIIPRECPEKDKLIRRLMRRGFSYSAIKRNLFHDNE
jgi:SOS response regulatory protein OraA/RecX